MKRKNNSLTIIAIFFLCSTASIKGIAQSISSVKDTVYVFICKGSLENGQPIVSYAILKDLSSLNTLASENNQDSFICDFFKQSILFEEPFFTLTKNLQLYKFSNDKEKKSFLNKLSKKISKLNMDYGVIKTKVFDNGKFVELHCAKLIGEFWSIPKTKDELNNYNHSFQVKENCYDKIYIYNLKDISKSCKLKIDELTTIQKVLNN